MKNASIVNVAGIDDKRSLHKILKEALDLPDYYGGNLDALKDMLTGEVGKRHLVLRGVNNPEPQIRNYIPKLIEVLNDSAEENPDFTYEIESDDPSRSDRRALVVCGAWEDAENFNKFLERLNIPEITSKYVICCYTFGTVVRPEISNMQIELRFADIMMRLNPAGIVLFAEMLSSEYLIDYLIKLADLNSIPVFMMEHKSKGCVDLELDYKEGFRQIVDHIVDDHKCSDIMMMAGIKGNKFSEERINVFKEVLSSRGIAVDMNKVLYGDFWHIPAINALEEYFRVNGEKLPQAIICANDAMAMGVTDHLIGKGYKIPGDCIITGFDGVRDSLYHLPTITTATPDFEQTAKIISSVIDEWDNEDHEKIVERTYQIPYRMILADSCGCKTSTLEEANRITTDLYGDNMDYFMHMQEMGRLTSQAITISDVNKLPDLLSEHLILWNDQMFFVGLTSSEDRIDNIFYSWNDKKEHGNTVYNPDNAIPYQTEIMRYDSGINYLLFSYLSSSEESFGYVCTGTDAITFRKQQRFEEMGSYLSSIIHSVVNNDKLVRMNKEMRMLSEMDYMTGLYNRRGFLSRIAKMIKEPQNKDKYLNYAIMDLDNLKPINDLYGHSDGDLVIKALANAIQTRVHKKGISSRYGGDEFAFVILSDEPLEGTENKLRDEIERAAQEDDSLTGKPYKILASVGLVSSPVSAFSKGRIEAVLEPIMNKADEKMYADKEQRHKEQNKGNA